MAMVKTPIEIDQEALALAAEVLRTKTKKDTVNAALREVGQRLVRLRALARLGEMRSPATVENRAATSVEAPSRNTAALVNPDTSPVTLNLPNAPLPLA